jgi:hypothetical protein
LAYWFGCSKYQVERSMPYVEPSALQAIASFVQLEYEFGSRVGLVRTCFGHAVTVLQRRILGLRLPILARNGLPVEQCLGTVSGHPCNVSSWDTWQQMCACLERCLLPDRFIDGMWLLHFPAKSRLHVLKIIVQGTRLCMPPGAPQLLNKTAFL